MAKKHLTEVELIEYADGETAEAKLIEIEDHLSGCDRCNEALAQVRQVVGVGATLKMVPAPREVRELVAQTFAHETVLQLSCRRAVSLLQEHLDGCLSPFAKVLLESHLEGCKVCRAELKAFSAATAVVRNLPTVSAPAQVWSRVEAARHTPVTVLPRRRLAPAMAGVAALLVIGLVSWLRPSLQSPESSTVAGLPAPEVQFGMEATEARGIAEAPVEVIVEGVRTSEEAIAVVEIPEERVATRPAGSMEVRPVAQQVKGPAPERAVTVAATTQARMPSAFRALRTVASSAAHESELRRSMEQVGERFAVLHSEAQSEGILARLPDSLESSDQSAGRRVFETNERPAPQDRSAAPVKPVAEGSGGKAPLA